MPTLFMLQTLLPSRRRDCHTNLSKTALSNPLFVGRGSVCACMVLHPCKTQGTHAKASLPCLPLPSRPTFPSPQPSQKHLNRLASHHHPCLLMNALLALRPCKASGCSTSGIHARPRKRVRFCCSVKPSQLWRGLKLIEALP